MRVLIVPDKFKGTLTAKEAAATIAEGWAESRPNDELELLPMSDGGDGFGEIIGELVGASVQTTPALNAAHEPIGVAWWWSESTQTAIVESAQAIGLTMLPKGKFHPFKLDTLGLGRLLQRIALLHPNANLIVGIGGSATNDAGFGMARGLGFRFADSANAELLSWVELEKLATIETPANRSEFANVTIATDVQNPLLGPQGATRIYGPQKGLTPQDFPIAESHFTRLVEVVSSALNTKAEAEPGTGAAGGLGYGLRVFLNGRFEPGFDIFARLSGLTERIRRADLVITGEGCIDEQTLMGKGTGAVAKLASDHGRKSLGLAGNVRQRGGPFTAVGGIHPDLVSLNEAISGSKYWLKKLASATAKIETVRGLGRLLPTEMQEELWQRTFGN